MISKPDSVLGRSVLDFARAVDKASGQAVAQLTPVAGR